MQDSSTKAKRNAGQVDSQPSDDLHSQTFQQYRNLLLGIAYRMLGSFSDAEDMVQETFLRWQQAAQIEVRTPRAFLVTVLSRLCINRLQSARSEREEYFGEWLPEPVLSEPSEGLTPADQAEIEDSLSIAFLVLLERLSPTERAVFLLREVFDYEHREIATMLNRSEPSCRQLLRRARERIRAGRPRFDATPRESENLLRIFLEAVTTGDLNALVALLAKDVVFHSDGGGKAPALPKPILGPQKVARAILGSIEKLVPKNLTRRIARINGQPGVVAYLNGRPYAVIALEPGRGLIQNLYVITNPEKLHTLSPLPAPPC